MKSADHSIFYFVEYMNLFVMKQTFGGVRGVIFTPNKKRKRRSEFKPCSELFAFDLMLIHK